MPDEVAIGGVLSILKLVSRLGVYGCTLVFSGATFAQAATFTEPAKYFGGTAIQLDVGYQPYSIKGSDLRLNYGSLQLPDQRYQGSSIPYFVGLSHTIALGSQATIAAQIEVNPVNRQYVLSVLPGYAFTPNIQGYSKVAFVHAQVSVDVVNNQNKTASTTGLTAGVGAKYLLVSNWYGFVEANYVKMNSFSLQTNLNGLTVTGQADYSGYNIMAGIGYKF